MQLVHSYMSPIRALLAPVVAVPLVRRGLVLVLLMVPGMVAAREIPFDAESIIADPGVSNPRSTVVADLNGDGANDALYAFDDVSTSDDGIAWNENRRGVGSSTGPDPLVRWIIDDEVPGLYRLEAADLDGDGDLDVLAGQSSFATGRAVVVYENPSESTVPQGSWDDFVVSSIGSGGAALAAADLDGDGDLDLIGRIDAFPDEYGWWENQSTPGGPFGTSWSFVSHSIEIASWDRVAAQDIDRDGDVDIVVIDPGSGFGLSWFDNTSGDGSTWTERSIAAASSSVPAVFALGDYDEDGDADVVAGNVFNELDWYENPGPGGYGSAWASTGVVDVGGTVPDDLTSLHAADLDEDGDVDILSTSWPDDRVAWYENVAGNGTSWTTRDIGTGAATANTVASGDLDEDGDVDVLVSYAGNFTTPGRVVWYDNRSIHRSAAFPQPETITNSADGAGAVWTADLDQDGDLDVLVASSVDDDVVWLENDGTPAGLGDWTEYSIDGNANGASSVVAADVNGDGHLDPIAASLLEGTIGWYQNNGTGTAFTARLVGNVTGPNSVFASDLDGDGDVDIVASSYEPLLGGAPRVQWFENVNGIGTSWAPATISTDVYPRAVWVDDVDGDGDADVLFVTSDPNTISDLGVLRWAENANGDGSSWISKSIDTVSFDTSLATADMDGDGDADVVTAIGVNLVGVFGYVRWYENGAGDGSIWTPHTIARPTDFPSAVSASDLDLDGDVDVVSRSGPSSISWYENVDGSGGSWLTHDVEAVLDSPAATHAADIDGDGAPDLVAASRGDDSVTWFRNGGGNFALPTTGVAPSQVSEGWRNAFLKIDARHAGRDGDDDVELRTIHLRFESAAGSLLSASAAAGLFDDVRIFVDTDDNDVWTQADLEIAVSGPFFLSVASGSVILGGGYDLAPGDEVTIFVVLELDVDASTNSPNVFQLRHVTESTSRAEHDGLGIPLVLEFEPNTSSGVVTVPEPGFRLATLACVGWLGWLAAGRSRRGAV